MLAEALVAAAARSGWGHVSHRAPGAVLVTDRPAARLRGSPAGNNAVLVCEPTAYAARRALDAVSELVAAAVMRSDEPADLTSALEGMAVGRASIPMDVLALAAQMPAITERQTAILGAVVAGQTNTDICRGMYLSPASVKRELSALHQALGSVSRVGLAASARELGVPACHVLP